MPSLSLTDPASKPDAASPPDAASKPVAAPKSHPDPAPKPNVASKPEHASSAEATPSPDAFNLKPGVRLPKFEFVYECDATLEPALDFGQTVEGHRRIIPITGGTVRGPRIRGELLSGGADWNLTRSDGAGSVEAAYYLKTDDGVLIRIVNKGVGDGASTAPDKETGERFFMFTHPSFEAPIGKYDWLNRSMFIGTLGARKDTHDAVLIRVFRIV
jgi:hypothetical protein